MRVALLGLPGSGKTTVFNAVAEDPADVPPGTIQSETHVQVIRVRDKRLERCREIFSPKKYTPAGVELWDPPGVPLGGGERERERRTRHLAALREVDAYVLVVRGFVSDRYPYERAAADPASDLQELAEELQTADFLVCEGRMRRLEENLKRGSRTKDEDQKELHVLQRVAAKLEAGEDLRKGFELDEADARRIRGFQFFTRKPFLLLVNGPDEDVGDLGKDLPLHVSGRFALDGQVEAEVAAMDPADRPAFLEEFGIEEPAAERFVHELYRGVGLRSFFTVGEDEVRAWTIRAGDSAVEAAGKIHTDLQRGFIRAEVYPFEALDEAGGEKPLKAKGAIRLEGKAYVVQDGDIVHIRSGV